MGRVLQQFAVLFRQQRFRRLVRHHPPRGFKYLFPEVHALDLQSPRFIQGYAAVEFLAGEIAAAHV